ncbi:drebrin-like protein [Clonorchis sinensis]|uniref:Drebrin-like protein n=1 Tax=Clonorchis sinensis TaxID=79923 RepID=H2KRY1_CLOSI|nr:drebrin-like protein [Clonorchis sinensis]
MVRRFKVDSPLTPPSGQNRDDMFDEFSPGRVLFGFVRASEASSERLSRLPAKYVFICWQGEGVPEKHKLVCAQHGDIIKQMCRTTHLTVHARNEDDLDWKEIINKIEKMSGSSYSTPVDNIDWTPPVVGTAYKKVDPKSEIPQNSSRMEFWKKQQQLNSPVSSVPMPKKPVGFVQPICDKPDENETSSARSMVLKQSRHSEMSSVIKSRLKLYRENSSDAPTTAPKKVDPRAEIMLARQLSQASCDDTDNTTVSSAYKKINPLEEIMHARKLSQPTLDNGSNYKVTSEGTNWQRADPRSEILAAKEAAARAKAQEIPSNTGNGYQRTDAQAEIRAARLNRSNEVITNGTTAPTISPSSQTSLPETKTAAKSDEPSAHASQPLATTASVVETPIAPVTSESDHGLVAVCLYDYVAGEEDELSFTEGDQIFHIQQIDEGWWLGVSADGRQGLFPANYVELVA